MTMMVMARFYINAIGDYRETFLTFSQDDDWIRVGHAFRAFSCGYKASSGFKCMFMSMSHRSPSSRIFDMPSEVGKLKDYLEGKHDA